MMECIIVIVARLEDINIGTNVTDIDRYTTVNESDIKRK